MVSMPENDPTWRPTWSQMLDIVERYNHTKTSAQEEEWLLTHPIEWLVAARHMHRRTEGHVAVARAKLREIGPMPGEPASREYLVAKRAHDVLNGRRISFMSGLKDQIDAASHQIGYYVVPADTKARVVDTLATLRSLLGTERELDSRQLIDTLLRFLDDTYIPINPYRPPPTDPE